MKKILAFLSLTILLSACGDRLHVDLEDELRNRPTVTLLEADGTEIKGFAGDFCTDTVCNNGEPIDFAALSYTPYTNGEDLTLSVDWEKDTISTVSFRTYDDAGDITHRELPFTQLDDHTFLIEEAFPNDKSDITLHVKVDFVVEGHANYYFPIHLQ